MKKVFFLLAMLFATASFAQNTVSTKPTKPIQPVTTVPCPELLGFLHNKQIIVNPAPAPSTKRVYVAPKPGSINGSFNTNINITVNPQPQQYYMGCGQCGRYNCTGHVNHNYGDAVAYFIFGILLLALLAAFIAWLADRHSRNHPNGNNPVTVQVPPAPSPVVVVPPSSDEINNAISKASTSGGTFTRSKDGGYSVEFPKPPAEKKENAQ